MNATRLPSRSGPTRWVPAELSVRHPDPLRRRGEIVWLPTLLILVSLCRPVAAQPMANESTPQRPRTSFLVPPSREAIDQGLQPLSAALPDITPRTGIRPPDASAGVFDAREMSYAAHRGGGWAPIRYNWAASELRHRPLYFEDAMLERHGQTRHPVLQPMASGARFFLTIPVLPYAMVVDPPRPAQSTLGYFRPGSAAPCLLQRPPLQADAGVVEAGVWVGLIFLIP